MLPKIGRVLDSVCEHAITILFSMMFLAVTFQIVARNILMIPAVWTDELARFLYVWIVFIGAVSITLKDEHVRVEVLISRLSPKAQKRFDAVLNLVTLVFCYVAIRGGVKLVAINRGMTTTSLPDFITWALIYSIIPISFTVIAVILAVKSFRTLAALCSGNESAPPNPTE